MCVCVCENAFITYIQYGSVTVVASRGEQVVVVGLTVWLPVSLKEVSGADLVLAVCTHKVLRVPCSAHGRHHLVWGDRAFKLNELWGVRPC